MTAVERVLARTPLEFEDDIVEGHAVPAKPRLLSRAGRALTAPVRRPWGWWGALEPAERVLYRGLVLLAGGLALVWPPLALIIPGAVLTVTALGFTFSRPERNDG